MGPLSCDRFLAIAVRSGHHAAHGAIGTPIADRNRTDEESIDCAIRAQSIATFRTRSAVRSGPACSHRTRRSERDRSSGL